MGMDKKEIRRYCRRMREEQSAELAAEKSHEICRQILASEEYKKADSVLVYIATQGEVSLEEVIRDAWEKGKVVASPRVEGKTMDFYRINSFEELEEGNFHVWEPRKECEVFTPGQQTLFLVPGVAYDESRRRVGYGGGFYDRFLERFPWLPTTGIGYEFQILPEVPCEPTDIPMKKILTEKGWRIEIQ